MVIPTQETGFGAVHDHVSAGKRGEIVWNFNRAGDFQFACLIPGYYQAGMKGAIKVASK